MGKGIHAVIKLLCHGICLLLLVSNGLSESPLTVTSPDGNLSVTFEVKSNPQPYLPGQRAYSRAGRDLGLRDVQTVSQEWPLWNAGLHPMHIAVVLCTIVTNRHRREAAAAETAWGTLRIRIRGQCLPQLRFTGWGPCNGEGFRGS